MNIFELEPKDFEFAMEELGLPAGEREELRREYSKNKSLSGQTLAAFDIATEVPEGRERATMLPITKPEGMSGLEAIRSGEAKLAVPGIVTDTVREALGSVDTGERASMGLEVQGEDLETAAMLGSGLGLSGAATRIGKPLDMSTVSSGGASGKVKNPLFVEKKKVPDDTELEMPFEDLVSFYSPIKNSVESLDFGKNGLTGNVILKHLREKTPNTNIAELDSYKLDLDPNKRYTREEIQAKLPQSDFAVREVSTTKYANAQRQNTKDKTSGYFILTLQGEKSVPFYHFTPKDLAHTRGSFLESDGKKRLLIEELQSDILQNVTDKPPPFQNPASTYFSDIAEEFEPLDSLGVDTGKIKKIVEDNLKGTLELEDAIAQVYEVFGEKPKSSGGQISAHLSHLVGKKLQEVGYSEASVTDRLWESIDTDFQRQLATSALEATQQGFTRKDFPVTSTADATKKLLLGLIAKAQKAGATEIVMPPLSRIAAHRAPDFFEKATGTTQKEMTESAVAAAEKALKPTYVDSFNKAVELLNKEFPSGLDGSPIRVYEDKMDFLGSTFSKEGTDTVRVLDISKFPPLADYELRFAEGGMVEDTQMKRFMQEGGITDDGMTREPVTGNEIPPGSLAEEVRDDIPAQLSKGEYVVPADVVRFFGVAFFEDLRNKAKEGLSKMDADGRIGGEPVDSQGVPLEEDDQLSPEEEQMLMEALGSAGMYQGGIVSNPYQDQTTLYKSPAGMAEGGMASPNTPFARTKFTIDPPQGTGFQSVKYYNPQTKEGRMVQFMNGVPLGSIPIGFVPWSEELAKQAETPAEAPQMSTEGTRIGGEGAGRAGEDERTKTADYTSWAEKNYDAINSDPLGFGMDALTGKGMLDGLGGRLAAAGATMAVGPMGALGVKAAQEFQSIQGIAEAQAALEVAKAKGRDTTTLTKALDKAINDLGGLGGMLVKSGQIATGKNYVNALTAYGTSKGTAAPVAPTGTRTGTSGGATTATTSGGLSFGSTGSGGGSGRDYEGPGRTSEALSYGGPRLGFSESTTGGRTTSTGGIGQPSGTSLGYGSVSGSGPSATTGMSMGTSTKESSADRISREGRAKGGLVGKPAEKKAHKPRKGLAS